MPAEPNSGPIRVALVGLPNVGKTTLFNELAGHRLHTSNFHGTTQEATEATVRNQPRLVLIDLPGVYTLADHAPESQAVRAALAGAVAQLETPDAACIVIDHTNLTRGIRLLRETAATGLPTFVLLHAAGRRSDVRTDENAVAELLGVPVVMRNGTSPDCARRLEAAALAATATTGDAHTPTQSADETAAAIGRFIVRGTVAPTADRADGLLLHPVTGLIVFAAVMWALFWSVFKLAAYPMDWIDAATTALADATHAALPPGPVADLLSNGIIGGVGATVIFLPQIALLFFLITLLEESGYLARGALLADRLLRPFRLPGTAFVPLLSAHACAIPAIVACRTIRDVRERVATILVAPFMSCSARIPVYALLVSFLFVGEPTKQAAAFVGCYALGIIAALVTALVLRRTMLSSPSSSTLIELPGWRRPSIRKAARAAVIRSGAFVKKAGTTILVMMIVLWWLSAYPQATPSPEVDQLRAAAAQTEGPAADAITAEADHLFARETARQSYMGRIGRTVEPVFAPLGYDWQVSIGVMTSFAAREVFVSTMAVVLTGEEEGDTTIDAMRTARRDDGSLLFNRPALWSLLVFYVLAMQCLPTLAVTAREAGGVKWAVLQLAYMTALAYLGALVAYTLVSALASGAAP